MGGDMTTISQVVTALAAVLDDIDGVDVVDTTGYDAAITTRDVALIIPPFEQASSYRWLTHQQGATPDVQSHLVRCEFWCKWAGTTTAAAATRARTVEAAIGPALMADVTLGDVVTTIGLMDEAGNVSMGITTRVDDVRYRDNVFYRVIAEIPVLILS